MESIRTWVDSGIGILLVIVQFSRHLAIKHWAWGKTKMPIRIQPNNQFNHYIVIVECLHKIIGTIKVMFGIQIVDLN